MKKPQLPAHYLTDIPTAERFAQLYCQMHNFSAQKRWLYYLASYPKDLAAAKAQAMLKLELLCDS